MVPAFFESVSANLLLLETAVIAQVRVMIQLDSFMTPLLAIILPLTEHFIQAFLDKHHQEF